MMASGVDGIDTLETPPLGTDDLATARRETRGQVFLKGNLDPVAESLQGTSAIVDAAARSRIRPLGAAVRMSWTACSVPPPTPPKNVLVLRKVAEELGRYPMDIGPDPSHSRRATPATDVARPSGRRGRNLRAELRRRHTGRELD